VGLTYAGAGEESLTDIDFTVKKGETIGIIGGTGSGKSSVVNLIPRFYDATKGIVQIEGKDVREYSLEELRGKIGMVLQKAVLFKGTIRENMLWGNENATDEDIMQALEVAQAKEFVDSGMLGGGMLPKLQNCIDAIENGVNRVHILDGRIPHCLLLEIFTNNGIGTAIVNSREERQL